LADCSGTIRALDLIADREGGCHVDLLHDWRIIVHNNEKIFAEALQ
jgi:hypothetical protein